MIETGLNSPLASSCGRLFDAVAAALTYCRDRQAYEGEAAMRLEAMLDADALASVTEETAYPFTIGNLTPKALPYIEPLAMWKALLADLAVETPPAIMAARFHKGLAQAVVAMVETLAARNAAGAPLFDTVALSGGCFQNRILFELVASGIEFVRGFPSSPIARSPLTTAASRSDKRSSQLPASRGEKSRA